MELKSRGLLAVFCVLVLGVNGQIRRQARWCTVSDEEQEKCLKLGAAIEYRQSIDEEYPPTLRDYDQLPLLICQQEADQFACMEKISSYDVDLVQLDPGMGYTAGEYFTMMPLMAEQYDTSSSQSGLSSLTVAVVKKSNRDININNLQGKKACHPGVGHGAGWVYPIATLIEKELMPITECNVPVKSATAFFGEMCAPNGLARFYNPFGNNPVTVCNLCIGEHDNYCTGSDPYAGYHGAYMCMSSGAGDVAFLRQSTLSQEGISEDDYELLCEDGSRRAISDAASCHWGSIPSHIVMTSAIHEEGLRNDYKELMKLLVSDFGADGKHKDVFQIFASGNDTQRNLMFSDETLNLVDVSLVDGGSRDTYYTWVGPEYIRRSQILNTCPLQQARWCVISRHEMTKCENMIMAFAAKGLKPDLNCILGESIRDCMDKIRMGDADMMSADAADVFVAGKYYDLVPIAAEDYSGYDAHTYYAVAVARRTDSHLTIFNLKARRSCHSGVYTAAGWITPVDKLIETGQIHVKDCNVFHSVGQFFSKSCVPGVLNDFYNTGNTNPINLCEACASGGEDRCQRNNEELYYGNSGAFRCLTENGGDVAFVKHTTARENTDGRNNAEWARNRRSDDYELLCNDGTRRDIDGWMECNLGEVPSNAILTANFKTEQEREIYWTLLNYAQQFFASDSSTDFSMFDSMLDHKDLIFQDSSVRLIPVEKEKQSYQEYLGSAFVRSMERMQGIDCQTAGASSVQYILGLFLSLFMALLLTRL